MMIGKPVILEYSTNISLTLISTVWERIKSRSVFFLERDTKLLVAGVIFIHEFSLRESESKQFLPKEAYLWSNTNKNQLSPQLSLLERFQSSENSLPKAVFIFCISIILQYDPLWLNANHFMTKKEKILIERIIFEMVTMTFNGHLCFQSGVKHQYQPSKVSVRIQKYAHW